MNPIIVGYKPYCFSSSTRGKVKLSSTSNFLVFLPEGSTSKLTPWASTSGDPLRADRAPSPFPPMGFDPELAYEAGVLISRATSMGIPLEQLRNLKASSFRDTLKHELGNRKKPRKRTSFWKRFKTWISSWF